jgi:hypothetical protein
MSDQLVAETATLHSTQRTQEGFESAMPAIELPQSYALPHGRWYRQCKTTTRSIAIIVKVYGFILKYVVCLETVIFSLFISPPTLHSYTYSKTYLLRRAPLNSVFKNTTHYISMHCYLFVVY